MSEREAREDMVSRLVRAFLPVRRMYIEHFQKKKLHFGEVSTLNLLAEAGGHMRVGDLASSLHVTPPTVTQLITRLERDGLIERQSDRDDRRVVRVCLTSVGREHIEQINKHTLMMFSGLCDALGEADTQKLTELLERVQDYFSKRYNEEGSHPC